jgi:hypothetical protein
MLQPSGLEERKTPKGVVTQSPLCMKMLWNFQPAGMVTEMAFMLREGSLMYSTRLPPDKPEPSPWPAAELDSPLEDAEAG